MVLAPCALELGFDALSSQDQGKESQRWEESAHPIRKFGSVVRALVFPAVHHWLRLAYNSLYSFARSFSKQSGLVRAEQVRPLRGAVWCAARRHRAVSL